MGAFSRAQRWTQMGAAGLQMSRSTESMTLATESLEYPGPSGVARTGAVEARCRLVLAYAKELSRRKKRESEDLKELKELTDFHGAQLSSAQPQEVQWLLDALFDMKDLELYPLIARLSLMLARHEQCLAEFDWKGELQERASMFHYETALQLLKTVSHFQEAQEIFNEATSLRRAGQQMIHWKHLWQTPSVYVRQLRPTGGTAWWDPKELPLAQVLEENVLDIRAELQMLLENGGRMVVDPAYPRLTTEGDWDVIRLYNDKKWDPAATTLAPKTVALLKERLPGQANGLPYIHHNTEEVCFFRMSPGTRILLHTGGCNARLNLSLGLMGCSDSFITVAQEERRWRDGQLFAFDDSCDHAARHDGPEDRWVLTVGIMHPDLVASAELNGDGNQRSSGTPVVPSGPGGPNTSPLDLKSG
ncbi:Aspartyl/asparaginyl beta-hydroxylase (Aspartate beta-hydroxylase) (ASP beta-hydroxylase) (Peptide-aspartate beta-dioxygenase) [Durusdinium trenchii]|uniref:Aspartyl/asparaginyl beta-hydroxylase (Aspartate beta-hydroxylase) (ASP beta-hydroxylase) (Peptide-aspartate beta-dioxygenase) n=1 Tax=Durusdinium trenchii TaxID=1381693 RepID=A0ABP0MRR6_9DINO